MPRLPLLFFSSTINFSPVFRLKIVGDREQTAWNQEGINEGRKDSVFRAHVIQVHHNNLEFSHINQSTYSIQQLALVELFCQFWPHADFDSMATESLLLTSGSCIRTTGMCSLLLCLGVAMLDRVMASSSSSMAGRNSVPLRVVCEPKLLSKAKPRVLWLREFLLSLRDSDGKTTR